MGKQFRCAFFTDDYETTVGFYANEVELPIGETWDRGPDDKGTTFLAGSGMVEVLIMPAHDHSWVWSKEKPRGFAIVIEVEDINALYERILKKNIPVAAKLADWEWGHRSFRIADPNGVMLYFFSEIDKGRE